MSNSKEEYHYKVMTAYLRKTYAQKVMCSNLGKDTKKLLFFHYFRRIGIICVKKTQNSGKYSIRYITQFTKK